MILSTSPLRHLTLAATWGLNGELGWAFARCESTLCISSGANPRACWVLHSHQPPHSSHRRHRPHANRASSLGLGVLHTKEAGLVGTRFNKLCCLCVWIFMQLSDVLGFGHGWWRRSVSIRAAQCSLRVCLGLVFKVLLPSLRGMNLPIFLLLVFELLLSQFLFRNPCHRNSCRLLRNLEMGLPCLQSSKLRSSHLCKLRNRQAPNCKLGNSHTLKLIHLRLPPIWAVGKRSVCTHLCFHRGAPSSEPPTCQRKKLGAIWKQEPLYKLCAFASLHWLQLQRSSSDVCIAHP